MHLAHSTPKKYRHNKPTTNKFGVHQYKNVLYLSDGSGTWKNISGNMLVGRKRPRIS